MDEHGRHRKSSEERVVDNVVVYRDVYRGPFSITSRKQRPRERGGEGPSTDKGVCRPGSLQSPSPGSPATGVSALTLLNQAGSGSGLVRIRLEEHKYHHAGDRNVQPNGERHACDSAVHREPARQREKERREHHGQSDDGKDYVAG